jgi:hypothetical protein
LIKYPAEMICYACYFLKYLLGLKKQEDKSEMIRSAEVLQATAPAASSSNSLGIEAREIDESDA